MKRSLAFELETRRERNQRGASMGAIMAKAKREKTARSMTYAKLVEHFGRPPGLAVQGKASKEIGMFYTVRIAVQLTRIAKGRLDNDGPDDALKNVRDGVADWLGVNDRDGRIEWRRGAQEPGPEKLLGVRVEIFDDTPGPDRVIDLLDLPRRLAEEAAIARRRVRGQVRKAKTTEGRRALFVSEFSAEIRTPEMRPTVGDLRAAAERVFGPCPTCGEVYSMPPSERAALCSNAYHLCRSCSWIGGRCTKRCLACVKWWNANRVPKPPADPGEERAACMLVPCEVCGMPIGTSCMPVGTLVYGVHEERARKAGITLEQQRRVFERDRERGVRKLATVKPREAWARLPWSKPCGLCNGSKRHRGAACAGCDGLGSPAIRWLEKGVPTLDGDTAPRETWMTVPEKHVEHSGWCEPCRGEGATGLDRQPIACEKCKGTGRTGRIRMVRREWTRAGVACWLYEPA